MSTNNTSLQERASQWRATAGAEQIVKSLIEMASEPSSKRFNKSRPARIERWQQLAALASHEAEGLKGVAYRASASKRVSKPRASSVVAIQHEAPAAATATA